jgi:hypothetical protein
MAIFKRFEVWLLLVLSIAGVGYVLWSENQADGDDGADSGPIKSDPVEVVEEAARQFEVREIRTVADGNNHVIEIELLGRNDSGDPKELTPPEVRLLAKYEGDEEESELPSFFLPFDPPPTLAPNGESIVTLKYWLEPRFGKSNPSLTLRIGNESFMLVSIDGVYGEFSTTANF